MIGKFNDFLASILDNFQSLFLLFARFTIAYGFYEPAMNKWNNIEGTASWLAGLGVPFPTFNVYMVATFETLGVVLLALGLFTRFISLPLIATMLVAIVTVHFSNGFSAGNNGFEIPLYYLLFLGIFTSFGAGKISIDYFFSKK